MARHSSGGPAPTQGAPLMFKGVIVLRPRFGGGRMDYEVECWEVNMLLLLLLS